MKTTTTTRLSMLAAALLVAATSLSAAPAAAQQVREIDRTNERGGTITGTVTREGRFVTRDISRTTAKGGTFDRTTTCRAGRVGGCRDRFSGTTAKGRNYRGDRAVAYGPRRTWGASRITGPRGNTRYRVRRGFRGWRR